MLLIYTKEYGKQFKKCIFIKTRVMKNLSEIEKTVTQLTEDEFSKFRQWFWQYENEKWDIRIEKDIAAERLAPLAAQALDDFRNGQFRKL
jgi:hypothetical protein